MTDEVALRPMGETSMVDAQVATAHRYPRNTDTYVDRVVSAVNKWDREEQEACFFKIPIKGKIITGGSIRLAEVCLKEFKNVRAQSQPMEVSDTHLVAVAVVWDLESNYACSQSVRQLIVSKHGIRFSEDLINKNMGAAMSKALRNATFKVVPYVKEIEAGVRKLFHVEQKDLSSEVNKALASFKDKYKVTADQVLHVLKIKEVKEVTQEDLVTLRGIWAALNTGEASIQEVFPGTLDDLGTEGFIGRVKEG